jgi:two-component system NtrC family sensor kinase
MLRSKLIIGFLTVIAITGAVSTAVGVHLIGSGIVREAQNKVTLDLNSARQIYDQRLARIRNICRFIALRDFQFPRPLGDSQRETIHRRLREARLKSGLDFLSMTDEKGIVFARSENRDRFGDNLQADPIVGTALRSKEPIAHTQIMQRRVLVRESEQLADKARILYLPTPRARPARESENTAGMVLKAAIPLIGPGDTLHGVLYGGILLNRNYEIVDKIKDIVYLNVKYKGKDIGTATIFQEDLRIATNVMLADGRRAIGTRVSSEVYDRVIGQGAIWTARAFVVNDWYLTAYAPIRNADGRPIGMLYVGLLEDKYTDMKYSAFWIFLGVTCIGILMALAVAYLIADTIVKPVSQLRKATAEIERGNFDYSLDVQSRDEIGTLAASFEKMCRELKETYAKLHGKIEAADDDLKKAYQELQEKQNLLVQKEKLASVGQLSAGVSHELNNPLSTILMFSHTLLKQLPVDSPFREDVEMIVAEADRCRKIVRGLLDFARQSHLSKFETDIAQLIEDVVSIMSVKADAKGVRLTRQVQAHIPSVRIDADQVKQMLVNLVDNGLDANDPGGIVRIEAGMISDGRQVEIKVSDNGCGISEEDLPNLFTPFFTTKQMGKGTGLGLAIAYGVVKMHAGSIQVDSTVGAGTTFTVTLPA